MITVAVIEERQLKDTERPLLVQLHWGKDDREGRFLLKRENDKTLLVGKCFTIAHQLPVLCLGIQIVSLQNFRVCTE